MVVAILQFLRVLMFNDDLASAPSVVHTVPCLLSSTRDGRFACCALRRLWAILSALTASSSLAMASHVRRQYVRRRANDAAKQE
jgi:hypothetical protein